MNPLVSVVIPTFNRKEQVLQAIESVLQQTYPSIEMIVVDDASTDGTAETLSCRNFPMPVQIVRLSKNRGPAAARNAGISRANGKYVALLDSDDHWLPTKLARQVEVAERHASSEGVLVYSPAQVRRRYETIVRPRRAVDDNEDIADYLFANGGYIAQPTVLISANTAREVRYRSDMRLHEDWDWYIRLQRHGIRFLMVPETLCIVDDRAGEGRSSAAHPERSLSVLEHWRPTLSSRAYLAFRAKYVAPQLRQTAPLRALRMIASAYLHHAINTKFFVLLVGRVVHPGMVELAYRLRDALAARRGAKSTASSVG